MTRKWMIGMIGKPTPADVVREIWDEIQILVLPGVGSVQCTTSNLYYKRE